MNRLTTALIVLAVIAGPPLLAGLWLVHQPWQPPNRTQIQAWAEQPLTAATIIAGCVAVAGLGWLLLLIYQIRRAVAGLRRRLHRLRHLPVPTPAQMTASSMTGVAAFALPAAPADQLQPLPAVSGTPQPTDSGHHADRSAQTQPAGIALPGGGWIPYPTATAVTALAAAAWLQRRRFYRPDPHQPRDHAHDPDLQPLPGAVDTIIAAVTDDKAPGHDRTLPPLLSQPLPAGVLLLTGPGAAAAARGLLVTAAYTDTSAMSLRPRDLHLLLPADHPACPSVVPPDADTGDCSPPRTSTSTVIALGDEPTATHHWHVTVDGTVTGTGLNEPHRLCTLDAQATADLLTLTSPQPASTPRADPQLPPGSGRLTTPSPEQATAVAYLTLLGGCHLTATGRTVHLRRTASLQILAYLAVHPQGATRNELTHAVWPHLPPATISQRLHTTLTDLRRQLRPLLDDDPVTYNGVRYRLNARAIATDLQQWRAAAQAMSHAVGTTSLLDACRDVADRYRGELAAGHTWPWLTSAREQARRTAVDACTVLAEHANLDEALHWLHRAITTDPYNEPMHHQTADLLGAAGDESGAAELIKRLHHRLAGGKHPPL